MIFINGLWVQGRDSPSDVNHEPRHQDLDQVKGFPVPRWPRVINMTVTHRTSHTHLNEQQGLLPRGQLAQVHRSEPTDRDCADRVVQRVDVCDGIPSVGRIQNDGADQRSERTGRNDGQTRVITSTFDVWGAQEEQMYAEEIEMSSEGRPKPRVGTRTRHFTGRLVTPIMVQAMLVVASEGVDQVSCREWSVPFKWTIRAGLTSFRPHVPGYIHVHL